MISLVPGLRVRPAVHAAALCCAVVFPPAHAAADATDTVVITATRLPEPLSRVLADVSVLDRVAIERSGATAVADLLARLPGIAFSRNGGAGAVTGVSIRGSETRHVAVYIDGLRVDSQTTGGALWEALPVDEVERIEVVRGPAAAVYGSDAVGGVVQLFTRRGQAGQQLSAGLSAGSDDTYGARAAVSGVQGGFDYALAGSLGRSRGENATASGNADRDGWRRAGLQARLGLALAPGQRLEGSVVASRLRSQYDGFGNVDDIAREAVTTAGLAWTARWSDAADTRLQFGETRGTYESQPSYYRTETTLRDLLLTHTQRVGGQRLIGTLAYREDDLLNPATAWTGTLRGSRHQTALGLGWHAELGAHALQVHLRHDDDSEFGGRTTGSAAWGLGLGGGWRVTASAGTAFRAPTLYQRFSEYGTAALRPEVGRNLEFGLRWAQGAHAFSATAWRNRVSQLIDFGAPGGCASTYGCYVNVGRARLEGLTLAGRHVLGPVTVDASIDWQDPRNEATNQRLPRRAREAAKVGASTQWAGWQLGAEAQLSGQRVEYDFLGNARGLGGYGVLAVHAARALAPGWTLTARVDNLADKAYQTAAGYPMPGRSLQLGLRWAPR